MAEKNIEVKAETIKSEPVVKKDYNGFAIASFICGIIAIFVFKVPCSIAAIVTGIIGIVKFKKDTEQGRWMAITGLSIGSALLLLRILFFMLFAFVGYAGLSYCFF